MGKLLLILNLFLSPKLQVLQGQLGEITVQIKETREKLQQCVKEGYQANYEFMTQACIEKRGWFDDCLDARIEKTVIKYDPVSLTYLLVRDRIGDKLPAETKSVSDAGEAWLLAAETNQITPDFLAHGKKNFIDNKSLVVKVRARASCDEDSSPILARLSDFITFGLFRESEIDIDWQTFRTTKR